MQMFDGPANSSKGQKRKEGTLAKLGRMRKTLNHQEPDRVPISDFFWGRFITRWRKDLACKRPDGCVSWMRQYKQNPR